jgi:hypothetical protein
MIHPYTKEGFVPVRPKAFGTRRLFAVGARFVPSSPLPGWDDELLRRRGTRDEEKNEYVVPRRGTNPAPVLDTGEVSGWGPLYGWSAVRFMGDARPYSCGPLRSARVRSVWLPTWSQRVCNSADLNTEVQL